MAVKMLADANRKLVYVPTLADYHKPTIAELEAGIDISCLVTAADFSLGSTGDDDIDDPALCASSNSTAPGRSNYEASMNFFRLKDQQDDKPWKTFTRKGLPGYLVQRIGRGAKPVEDESVKPFEQPWAEGDEVQVYQVMTSTPQILSPESGGFEKFAMNFRVQDQVDERAKVSAG